MSDNTVMYTPSILKYNVSFQPNPSVGNYTPDKIVFKNVSQLLITMTSTGQQCQVKERGGIPARKRRIEYRKQKLPNEKDSNASVKNDKEKQEIQKVELPKDNENTKEEKVANETDIANEDKKHQKKLEEIRNNIKERRIQHQLYMAKYNMKVGTNNKSENTTVTLDDKIFGKLPKKVADREKVDINIESAKHKSTLDTELDKKVGTNNNSKTKVTLDDKIF